MIVLDLSILNQKGTPMFNSDLTANRPAAGIVGRIFIAIDAPYGIFRDTGTAWDQVSSAGGADTNIYNTDGTLTGTRTISSGGYQLVFNPQTTFFSSLIPSTTASSFSVLGSNTLTYAVGFSSSNIGNVYSANGAINAQIFSGNATFAQANLASAMVNVNKIDFSSGGHSITMTQSTAPGIRAMTGVQNQIQFTGSHNGTISHAAISQNLGFFRESGSTRTLTITNAYSLLINPLDDYGAGFTFTNRWGIYQAGASDNNYFAANVSIATTTTTRKLNINQALGGNCAMVGLFASGGNLVGAIGAQITTDSLQFASTAGILFYTQSTIGGIAAEPTNQRMQLTTAGRLLIGTTTEATFLLDVNGTARVSGSSTFARILATTSGIELEYNSGILYHAGGSGSYYQYIDGTSYTFRSRTATGSLIFGTQDLSRMRITSSGNLLIGTATDIASSILTLDSVTQGFLPPRMTTAEKNAIATPAAGLVVYDKTLNKLCVYTTAWETITSL